LNLPHTVLTQAAAAASAQQHYAQSALYMAATPIGNLADITLRALHVLSLVDAIACEDTRHSSALLRSYGIDKPLLALHEHNEAQAAQSVVARLLRGERVAYISDAGTPALSDPGARLAAAVRAAGLRVVPLPGASSITTLLSAAGLVGDGGFVFAGFLPSKAKEREAFVSTLAGEHRAVLLLEAPHRIEAAAKALGALGMRAVTVGRELTKQFEDIATVPAQDFSTWLAQDTNRTRGEFVLAIHAAPQAASKDTHDKLLQRLLQELPLKTAVQVAADVSGQPRNALYEQALAMQRTK
jgi:16S rRNA (cytidine1402-2'-O)-methyltransferase